LASHVLLILPLPQAWKLIGRGGLGFGGYGGLLELYMVDGQCKEEMIVDARNMFDIMPKREML
jgi:hypothetical protein